MVNINHGKLNGEYKEWYYNGQLWEECTYVNGEIDGEYKRWYENGQLLEECIFLLIIFYYCISNDDILWS